MSLIRLYTVVRREVQRFMRIPIQTVVSPLISGLLFIFVFGFVVGSRITFLDDITYIDFVFPGILMMNIIASSFGQSSTSLFFHRFTRSIEEMLTSPLSYAEMIIGYVVGAIARAVVVSIGLFALAVMFTTATIDNVGLFFFYIILVSTMFALLGLLVGILGEKFEHLTIMQTFVITPLVYIGGVFNSVEMLPPVLQTFTKLNPFFYMIDGLRYSMIGYSESNLLFGTIFLIVGTLLLFGIIFWMFKKGYKIRK
jgi:ABC-2 type transport system permease protein